MKKKLLSLCLALLMLLTMLPVTALAAGPGSHGEAYDLSLIHIFVAVAEEASGRNEELEAVPTAHGLRH